MAYDIAVLGSGPGGYVAAIRASQLGLKTVVIEKESLGGICLNWGCIPTKALLKSAQVFDYTKHAEEYGLTINKAAVDFEKVIKRSRNVADGMNKGVQYLLKKNKVDVVMGTGKVKNANTLSVKDENGKTLDISAKHIILSTGARSRKIKAIPQDGKQIIGYREAMNLPTQPKKMIIIGSGAIGSEFAYFYNAIGTEVTLIEYMPRILPVEDEKISAAMDRAFKKQGIKVMAGTEVLSANADKKECSVKIKSKKGEETLKADIVLSAIGIEANLEDIGLDTMKINTEKGKIKVDEFYNTSVKNIYAIGDIVSGPALAHLASHEGIVCVEKIAGKNPQPINYNNIPACTYCQPEVASVGYTEQAAKDAGYEVKVGEFPFSASGKASAAGTKEGFVKVVFDAKYGEFLGAHMMGANVTEMIAEVVAARKLETTGMEIIHTIHPHPTMSEAVMEATAAAYGEVIHI